MGRSGRRIHSFAQFTVHDGACGMKVGTDALLLGAWAGSTSQRHGSSPAKILDIGTGSGILALMLAQRFPLAEFDAVELEPGAARQAEENVKRSPFANRIQVHQRAIQGWTEKADLVVCNPPFFHNHPKSHDRKRNLARHDDTLPLRVLFQVAINSLSDQGHFDLVFPENRAIEMTQVATSLGLSCHARVALRATPKHDVIRCLWSWSRTASNPLSSPLDVIDLEGQEGQGSWSPAVLELLAPFLGGNASFD